MKIIAIVQARTNSLRLPRKVLKSIQGIPLIVHLLRRVNESKKLIDYPNLLLKYSHLEYEKECDNNNKKDK